MPVDFAKALLSHNHKGVTGIYARWHMFEEKREAVLAVEAALLPMMPVGEALAAWHITAIQTVSIALRICTPSTKPLRSLGQSAESPQSKKLFPATMQYSLSTMGDRGHCFMSGSECCGR
jgi:hypothetical protein